MPNIKKIDKVIALIKGARDASKVDTTNLCTVTIIRRYAKPFYMGAYSLTRHLANNGHLCQTPSCIAGWTCAKATKTVRGGFRVYDKPYSTSQHAADLLGLDYKWAVENLFVPNFKTPLERLTKTQAITALTRIKDAGDDYILLDKWTLWDEPKPRAKAA